METLSISLNNLKAARNFHEKTHQIEVVLFVEDSNDTLVRFNLAVVYRTLGDTSVLMGQVRNTQGYYVEARKLGEVLLIEDPENTRYKYYLAITYSKLGDVSLAWH